MVLFFFGLACAQSPNLDGPGDRFDVSPDTLRGDNFNVRRGGNPAPAPQGRDQFAEDPQCGGHYRDLYGPGARVMTIDEANKLYLRGATSRCADCSKSGPGMVICWPSQGAIGVPPEPPIGLQQQPCASVLTAAQTAMSALTSGQDGSAALYQLDKAQRCLPPSAARPIDCYDMMVDAQSKRGVNPQYSVQRAKQALECYEAKVPRDAEGQNPGDYVNGFLNGFSSCFIGAFIGSIIQIQTDAGIYSQFADALLKGDAERAGTVLKIKGERDRVAFDAFVKSLNPQIIKASAQESGQRDGSRLCLFGVLPGLVKAAAKGPIHSSAVLAQISEEFQATVQNKAQEIVSTMSNSKRGAVLTGVLDTRTGAISYGLNEGIPSDLHPLLRQRLDAYLKASQGNTPVTSGIPGVHSEINALNRALRAREALSGQPVTGQDLSEFLLHNRALRNPNITEFAPTPCANCAAIIYGVSVLK